MAKRHPVLGSNDGGSGLETSVRPYDPPLLPYEIALIQALGCTDNEYRKFVRFAQQHARVRPAEYAHIPEINNFEVVAIVSLVLGLASTAVSVLLAPKAPTIEKPARIKGRKLADQIGPSSFNQTTSFDNVASLAEYGQPIPIPFGAVGTGEDGLTTGGLSLAPALVWSRVYSHGSYQSYEGLYIVGEYGLAAPNVGGVRLGTFALDTLGDREYALLWKSQQGDNFPTNVIAGTVGIGPTGSAGRPLGQIFFAPGEDGQYTRATSIAYNLQSQAQFGTATPIHNGTAFRFNWEIVSAPEEGTLGEDKKRERYEIRAKRRKIAGADADTLHKYKGQTEDEAAQIGQPGVGRAYSRRMGIVAHNNKAYSDKTIVNVKVGDSVVFEINGTNWKDFQQSDFMYNGKKTEVNLKDLKANADAWRERASELLSIGSRWIISGSIWIVESRLPDPVYKKGQTLNVGMKCVALVGVSTVGIAGTRTVREPLGGYNGRTYNNEKHCGAGFFTLTRLYQSSIRPVRRDCTAIEFGIRSQVWNKANGLCNFNEIPSPTKLFNLDKRNITLNTPRMDKYFARTSCFSVLVRVIAPYGKPENTWHRIPELFCITGSAPIDQYNYLRIKPVAPGEYEYRFIPRPGSDITQNSIDTNTAVRLNAENGTLYGRTYKTPIGSFRVTTTGEEIAVASIKPNEEMFTDPVETEVTATETTNIPTAVVQSATSTNTGVNTLIINSWLTHYFGYAWDRPNESASVQITMTKDADPTKTLTIEVSAQSIAGTFGVNVGQDYINVSGGSTYKWQNITYTTISATGSWAVGDTIKDAPNVSNAFSSYAGYTQVNIQFQAVAIGNTAPVTTTTVIKDKGRIFEAQSQIADCSHFLELQKSNENGPEHEIVYVNEFIDNSTAPPYYNMSTAGLVVKSSGQLNAINQLRIFSPVGINVQRLTDNGFAPSNLFADLVYYLLTSKSQGVGNVVPAELIDKSSLTTTARFLAANKIFYDGVVEDSESIRAFLADNAPLNLCNFTIKNGRFGMIPALPYNNAYKITSSPIAVDQIFTAGNIIADSLQLQYIDAAQRTAIRAIVAWRVSLKNDLPTQASAIVDWADIPEGSRAATQQSFDLTGFCTNRAQALKIARFLMSVRRRVTHTVSFKTVPDSLGIQPGSYIRIITAATSYSATNNGVITDAGTLVTINTIPNGTYTALVYNPATSVVDEQKINITGNKVLNKNLYGTLFTLLSENVGKGVYQVEQLTLDEDGLVNVSAVHVPTSAGGGSIVAEDVLTASRFRVLE